MSVVALAHASIAVGNRIAFFVNGIDADGEDVIVATTKAQAELQTVEVEFKTANVVFLHTGGIVCGVIVVVVVECAFRMGQVTELENRVFAMLVLDKCSVVMDTRGFVVGIGFEFYEGRPIFVELDIKVHVNS